MGIWIRSQNGMILCNANVIWVDRKKVYTDGDGSHKAFIGEYPSEGDAQKVVDQIQEYVIFHERVRLLPSEDWETPRVVFQMPPAGFSRATCDCCGKEIDQDTYNKNGGFCGGYYECSEKFTPECEQELNYCGLMDGTNQTTAFGLS